MICDRFDKFGGFDRVRAAAALADGLADRFDRLLRFFLGCGFARRIR